MRKLVSIIIPVYNAENDLKRCVDSILNQTYKYFELIIVNDGSIDNSEKICFNYAKKDSRVKYFYQKNSGVSKARNFGFEKSKGQYIYYVDSDDFLESNAIEIFLNYSEKYNADVVRCSYRINNRLANEIPYLNAVYNSSIDKLSTDIIANIINYRLNPAVWLLFMKREVAKEHLFLQNFGYGEDLLYTLDLLLNCNNVVFIKDILYNYIVNENGASLNYNKYERNILNLYDLVNEVNFILEKNNVKNMEFLMNQALITYFYMIIQYIYLEHEKKQISLVEYYKKMKKFRKSDMYKKLKIKDFSSIKKYRKIIIVLYDYYLFITIFFVYKIKKIIKGVKKK